MTYMKYIWTIEAESAERSLDRLIALMSVPGLSAFLRTEVGPYLRRRAKQRFASEGDDVTGPWTPLAPATILWREAEGYGAGPINRRTGELEEWVTQGDFFAYPVGPAAVEMEYPKGIPGGELFTKLQTAQSGKPDPKTPPRPVIGVNEADMLYVMTALTMTVEALK